MTVNEILNMPTNGEACPSVEAPEEIFPAPATTDLRPMALNEFRAMPHDQQYAYIMALRDRWHAGNTELALMWGLAPKSASRITCDLGCPHVSSGNWSKVDGDGFRAWLAEHGWATDGSLVPERTLPYYAHTEPAPKHRTKTAAPASTPSPVQAKNSITYHGALADAAVMLAAMGNADSGIRHVVITWS